MKVSEALVDIHQLKILVLWKHYEHVYLIIVDSVDITKATTKLQHSLVLFMVPIEGILLS